MKKLQRPTGRRVLASLLVASTALLLTACGGDGAAAPEAASPFPVGDKVAGRATFVARCISCHGLPPNEKALFAAGRPDIIVEAVARIPPMKANVVTISNKEAADIAAWLLDPK
jgi:mono/diheme cytochrome c family protein